MMLCTTNDINAEITLREAVLSGLAKDGGLYLPRTIPKLPNSFFQQLPNLSLQEIGFFVTQQLVQGAIPDEVLHTIIEKSLSFPAPVVPLKENLFSLELFHGPTLSFKDFGARFMAELLHYFVKDEEEPLNILVATSGDTGSAVANGFYDVPGMKVWVLYPQGKITPIQEQQTATLGKNINAIEVQGVFDDCQRLVKEAFQDEELRKKRRLTSANSINIARLIPQSFYYFFAAGQVGTPPVFSVPCGNFGNLTGGLLAKKMGLSVEHFVVSTNINDIVPQYLKTGIFKPRPSQATLSNAMDVGNPSNFARMRALYQDDFEQMQRDLYGTHFNDEETLSAILEVWESAGYLLDPHGAVAYLGLREYQQKNGGTGVFFATAHPAKFREAIEEKLNISVPVPKRLQECMDREKQTIVIKPSYDQLREILLMT
ncbi:MAG: Threonine synthase [Chlamydiae bacterium]|nr:Threonine synthase [Chlamydiota bacterium]